MIPLIRHKLLWLGLLVDSLATAWLGYSLVINCLQDWIRLTDDSGLGDSFWGKAVVLVSWLVAALYFLRDRNGLTQNKS